MPSLSHFFDAICYSKDIDQYTEEEIKKDYSPFLMNRMIAQYKSFIFLANWMNKHSNIDNDIQLKIYMDNIPKKKRQALWINKFVPSDLAAVMEYYNITQEKADPYMKILTPEQIDELARRMETGGEEDDYK